MHEILTNLPKKQPKVITPSGRTSIPTDRKTAQGKNTVIPTPSIRIHYLSEKTNRLRPFASMTSNNNLITSGHNAIQRVPIEVTERETKETGIANQVIFPGLDSCIGITVKIEEQLHAIHLAIPFEIDHAISYCEQVDTIYKKYFAASEDVRDFHISYKSDAKIFGTNSPTNSHNEVDEHIANLRVFNGSLPNNELLLEEIKKHKTKLENLEKSDTEIEEQILEIEEQILEEERKIDKIKNLQKSLTTCIAQLTQLKNEEKTYTFGPPTDSIYYIQTGGWSETRRKLEKDGKVGWYNSVSYSTESSARNSENQNNGN